MLKGVNIILFLSNKIKSIFNQIKLKYFYQIKLKAYLFN
jgi:hypothetical protein